MLPVAPDPSIADSCELYHRKCGVLSASKYGPIASQSESAYSGPKLAYHWPPNSSSNSVTAASAVSAAMPLAT